jgi:hypothetical protein
VRPDKFGERLRVGVISDTHNLLRESAKLFLAGCDHIIHAGDICRADVLTELSSIAPVTAVRGNNDKGAWASSLATTELIELAGVCFYVIHDIAELDIDPEAAGVAVVVSGHSHRPTLKRQGGVLYLNPGSAGPRRFTLPISIAEVVVNGSAPTARLVELAQ